MDIRRLKKLILNDNKDTNFIAQCAQSNDTALIITSNNSVISYAPNPSIKEGDRVSVINGIPRKLIIKTTYYV